MGKNLSLVALGMFHDWLPLEGERETSFSHLFIFHPKIFYLKFFSVDFRALFYHGSKLLFCLSFFFPLPINYIHVFRCTKSFTHSLLSWFWSKIFFISLNSWSPMTMSYRPQAAQVNERIALGVILGFNTNPAPSW
jgi:hypothetical protein